MDEPVLDGSHTVTQYIRIGRLLHSELGEMTDAVGNQFKTLDRIQIPLIIEQIVHIHTSQLGDALFLRHLSVKLVNLLFHIDIRITACQEYRNTD